MATTITCEVATGNGQALRPSINNFLFVECETAQGNGAAVDCKIGTGVGAGILVVDSWDPVDNSVAVEHLASFKVQAHANTGSAEYTKLYDDATDFDAGTYDNVSQVGDGLQLEQVVPSIDFEDYTLTNQLTDASNPDNWTSLDQESDANVTIQTNPTESGMKAVRSGIYNSTLQHRLDDAGTMYAGEVMARFYFAHATDGVFRLTFQHTGAGTAMRGYAATVENGSQYIRLQRVNDWNSFFGVATQTLGIGALQDATWYWMKIYFSGDSTTWVQYKVWEDGTSEPASYSWLGSDSSYTREGYVGFCTGHNANSPQVWMDDFSIASIPAIYETSGTWESEEIDVTAIGLYSAAVVTWDETTPAGTTASVKARWRNGGTWAACTNGGFLPGITAGEHTTPGSSKDSLELRVELSTTDDEATPEVANLQVYHEPFANARAMVTIDPTGGDVDCTEADGTLEIWGKAQVSGGSPVTEWDAIVMETYQPYRLLGAGRSMSVELWYDTWLVDEISVTLVGDYWMVSNNTGEWRFGIVPWIYEGPPAPVLWNLQEQWFPGGHGYDWVLVDYTMGMRQDASYLVGHIQVNDAPGFYIAGALSIANNPGFYLANGYKRQDTPGFFLAQAWRRNDQPGYYMPGIITTADQPGMFIVGIQELADQPGFYLVRGVNTDGMIEVTIIDSDAWAELAARGYTRG